jgi:hypothetical protein
LSPLSLLTFFAAAKKVSAAPHRGNANRPLRIQGKANPISTQPKPTGMKPKKKEQSKETNNTAIRKNCGTTKPTEQQPRAAKEKCTPLRGQKNPLTSARNPDQSQTDT